MVLPGSGHAGAPPADFGSEGDEQLTLADADERLPWLESDDDDEQPGVDTGRILAFAAVGLLAVVLLLGVLYFLTREPGDGDVVADGSTIEAPDEPYRTRPADPGGQEVAGTGDTSFEVAEGETIEGQIAGEASPPAPSIDRNQGDTPAPAPSAVSGGIGVQVGAYSSRAAAETGWSQLTGRIDALQGHSHRIIQGTADSGTIYRLQAVAGSAAEADSLCRSIRSEGGDCQVKR